MNTLSTLGTLHDLFLSNPNYGLRDFTSALYQFKPDVIFSEVRAEYPGVLDACIDGGIEQVIVYAYAKENEVPVVATDWFDAEFIQEAIAEDSKITPEIGRQLGKAMGAYQSSFRESSLLQLHSDSSQNQVKEIYQKFEVHGLLASRKRNEKIVANMKRELKAFQNKKILVIYGMDHKYFIEEHLSKDVHLLAVDTWFNSNEAKQFEFSESLRKDVIRNLQNSEKTLATRIESNHYPAVLNERLRAKLPRFAEWLTVMAR